MAKEVLIYGGINSSTAANFINDVNSIVGDLVIRIDSNGGEPQATYGMVAKYNEFQGSKKVKIDGRAFSSAFFFAAMAENVEALDVSSFMIHRAALPEATERFMTVEQKAFLGGINADLRKGFESKVDIAKFEAIAGNTVDEVFAMDKRINVFLNAEQALEIGLINKITPLTSQIKAEIDSNLELVEAVHTPKAKQVVTNTKIEKMTIEKLKAEHPDVYSAILAERNDTVGAWLAFVDVDAKAVSEGIKSGNAMTQTAMAEFSLKSAQASVVAKVESDAIPEVTAVAPAPVVDAKTELETIEAKLMATLK